MKVFGRISYETLDLLVGLVKFYLETKLHKNIVVQSSSEKIIFTEEEKKPGLCGLFKSLEHPNTNLRGEVLTFVIDKLFIEKYPEISEELSKIITTEKIHIDTTIGHNDFTHA